AEAGATLCGCCSVDLDVPDQLDREQIRPRIEPDEELGALALDRLGEPVGEQRRGDGRLGAHATEATGGLGRRPYEGRTPAALVNSSRRTSSGPRSRPRRRS